MIPGRCLLLIGVSAMIGSAGTSVSAMVQEIEGRLANGNTPEMAVKTFDGSSQASQSNGEQSPRSVGHFEGQEVLPANWGLVRKSTSEAATMRKDQRDKLRSKIKAANFDESAEIEGPVAIERRSLSLAGDFEPNSDKERKLENSRKHKMTSAELSTNQSRFMNQLVMHSRTRSSAPARNHESLRNDVIENH